MARSAPKRAGGGGGGRGVCGGARLESLLAPFVQPCKRLELREVDGSAEARAQPRQHESAQHRAAAEGRGDDSEAHGVELQVVARQQRHQRHQRRSRQEEQQRPQHDDVQITRLAQPYRPRHHTGEESARAGFGRRPLPAQQRQHHGKEGHGVEGEQRDDAGRGIDQPANARAQGAGGVEAGAVERHRLRQQAAADQLGHGRLPGRAVHGIADAQREGQQQQAPGGELADRGQRRQGGGAGQHPELAADQVAATVELVGQHAGGVGEEERRQGAGSRDQRHEQRRGRQMGHFPGRADPLHPGADIGNEVGDPDGAEGAVAQRLERARRRRQRRRRCEVLRVGNGQGGGCCKGGRAAGE